MALHQDLTHKHKALIGDAPIRRFSTPIRRVFKRLHVMRKKPTTGNTLADQSNIPTNDGLNVGPGCDVVMVEDKRSPPPAPRPSRFASPSAPPSPISPLPPTISRSSNMLTVRSGAFSTSLSHSSLPDMSDNAPPSSSPMPPLPRRDLFQLGLTPVASVRSAHSMDISSGCPAFAPALPETQRVSSVNVVELTAEVDMMDVVNMDLDDPRQATPTPASRTGSMHWLPALASKRPSRVSNNASTTAVFEGGAERRPTFMSKLVGSAWGLTGIGLSAMHGHRRVPSVAPLPPVLQTQIHEFTSLPSIPIGKSSIECAVLGATSRLSAASAQNSLIRGLPPANSAFRMTGSKSARAMDHSEDEDGVLVENVAPEVKAEERPKKKRRSSAAENFLRSSAPSPTPGRVTRAMAARQAEIEANTPTRVTRSASKRLQELANSQTPTRLVSRSKSLKRL